MPFVSSALNSFEKWRSPLFGATGNFNHQIPPYGILLQHASWLFIAVISIRQTSEKQPTYN
jgi:hypothetical protein